MSQNKLRYFTFAVSALLIESAALQAESAPESNPDLSAALSAITKDASESKTEEGSTEAAGAFTLPSADGSADELASSEATGETETIDGEEVYVLSDFEVSVEEDQGYHSANVLSGTRTNALIKDTPMTISVINEQLIEDLDITDLGDLSVVMAGVEATENGRFANGTSNRQLKIRGLLSGSQLDDFMPRSLPQDGYNIARTEVARGTNTMVFGQSEPGGKANTIPHRAIFGNNKTKASFTYGEHAKRVTIDRNMEVNDELAFRVMGGYSNKTSQTVNSERTFTGGTVAATWRPTNKTTFQFHLEAMEQDNIVPNTRYVNKTSANGRTGITDGVVWLPEIVDYMSEAQLQGIYDYQDLIGFPEVDPEQFPEGSYHIQRNKPGVDVTGRLDAGSAINSQEELVDFMSAFNSKNLGALDGKDSRARMSGLIGLLNVTHSFADNLQGRLGLFAQSSLLDRIKRNSNTAVYFNRASTPSNNDSNEIMEPYVRATWGTIDTEGQIYGLRGTLSWDVEFEKSTHQMLFGVDGNYQKFEEARQSQIFKNAPDATYAFESGLPFSSQHLAYDYFSLIGDFSTYDGIHFNETVDNHLTMSPSNTTTLDRNGRELQWILNSTEDRQMLNFAGWTAVQSKFFGGRLNTLAGIRLDFTEVESTVTRYQIGGAFDSIDDPRTRAARGGEARKSVYRSASPSLGGVYWLTENVGLTGSWSKSILAPDGAQRYGKLDGVPDYSPIWVPDVVGTPEGEGPGYYEQPRKHELRSNDEWITSVFVGWKGQLKKGRGNPKYSIQLSLSNLFDYDEPSKAGRYSEGRTYTVKAGIEF